MKFHLFLFFADSSRECENIQSISNGKPKRTILFEGDTLAYECNHGYLLEELGEQKCRSGSITGTYPRCILKGLLRGQFNFCAYLH